MNKELTRFTYSFARKSRLAAVFFLVFGTSIFLIPSANAAYANTTVICSDGTNQRSYQIGWDNSNIFFADKGYIPRFFCEGGYAVPYRTYVSDTLNGSALGYYNGVVTSSNPTPSEPSPSPSPTETATATPEPTPSESATPTPSPSSTPEPEPSPSATPDTSTSQSSAQETQTSQTETPTATPTQTDSSTVPSDTATVVAPVDGSTATSQPAPQPEPTPPAPPAVEPTPVEEPVVAPEEEPLPEPEPEVVEEVAQEEAPEPITEPEVVPEEEDIPKPEAEATVTLDNGVVLTQEQAVAVALLQDPAALVQELFTNPAAAFAALGQVGADMSPEVREKSEKVVISAVIAGNIATQAAATAGAVAAYRRKP